MNRLNVRLRLVEGMNPWHSDGPMDSPEAAISAMRGLLGEMDREYFCVVNLNGKNSPLNYNIVSIGKVNMAPVRLADVFKSSLLSNAKRVLLLHNHPSGDPTPSGADHEVTRKLLALGEILGVRVLDQVIVGNGSYFSFREMGFLDSWRKAYREKRKDAKGRQSTGRGNRSTRRR